MQQLTSGDLLVKLQSLQWEVQTYLAERKSAHNIPSSEKTYVYMEYLEMNLYFVRAVEMDGNGNYVFAPPFYYLEEANFLESHPKFGVGLNKTFSRCSSRKWDG